MVSTPSIHISDIRSFRQCRRKWDWSSGLRQNLEPIIPYAPFFTGRAIHAALEFYYRDNIPLMQTVDTYLASEEAQTVNINLWDSEKGTFAEQIQLIRDLIAHYSLWISQDTKAYSDKNLEFISLEEEFQIPIPRMPYATFGGRLDGLVRHKVTGDYWIWETKTARSIPELINTLANDEQSGLYMYAARLTGRPVAGVIYNIIRKKAPAFPTTLQSGLLSKARSIDTTAFHFAQCIRQTFPDWQDDTILNEYGDLLAALSDNEGKFFIRFPIHRNEHELEALVENLRHTAIEMVNPDIPTYPAPSWMNCGFCTFKGPCLTQNAGGNFQSLIDEEYQPRVSATSMRKESEDVQI